MHRDRKRRAAGPWLHQGGAVVTAAPRTAVVLEECGILCGLGSLDETVTDLFDGASAIVPGPCFGVPVAYAPFANVSWRSLRSAAEALGPVHERFGA